MALIHPDDLRAEADRLYAQSAQLRDIADHNVNTDAAVAVLREIAVDIDRRAGATLMAAEHRDRVLQARKLGAH